MKFRNPFRHVGPRTALALVVLILLGVSGLLERGAEQMPFRYVQDGATAYLDASKTKAIEAFAAGRLLNGALSFLKSVEITPLGVGAAPLQALEPVDDLAKQFSDVMLVSIAAILLQQLLLSLGTTMGLTILLPIGLAVWLLADTIGESELGARLGRLARGVVILALFARLVIPVAGWADAALTDRFLAHDLNHAVGAMQLAGDNLTHRTGAAEPPAVGRVGSTWQSLVAGIDTLKNATTASIPDLGAVSKDLEDMPNQIVTAIEIFLVQTILAPLLMALMLYAALRSLVPSPRATELAALHRLTATLAARLERGAP